MKEHTEKNAAAAVKTENRGVVAERIAKEVYEKFKLQWMLDHGHTLRELICELETLRSEGDHDMSLESVFADWEFGYGFGSEIWPCFEEFLACDYKEMEGIAP